MFIGEDSMLNIPQVGYWILDIQSVIVANLWLNYDLIGFIYYNLSMRRLTVCDWGGILSVLPCGLRGLALCWQRGLWMDYWGRRGRINWAYFHHFHRWGWGRLCFWFCWGNFLYIIYLFHILSFCFPSKQYTYTLIHVAKIQ